MGKFQTGKAEIRGENGGSGHRDTGHNTNAGLVDLLHAVQAILQANHDSFYSGIGSQYIGASTKNSRFFVQ